MYTIYHHPPTDNYVVCGPSYRGNFCDTLEDAIDSCNSKSMFDVFEEHLMNYGCVVVATTNTLDNLHIDYPELFI